MIKKPLIRLTVLLAMSTGGIAVSATDAEAMTSPDRHTIPTCRTEDGSYLTATGHVRYQRVCVWDARRLGNRRGKSFLLVQGPRGGNPVYFYITRQTAQALTR